MFNESKKLRLRVLSRNSKMWMLAKQKNDKSKEKIFFEITIYEDDMKKQQKYEYY
jgi:hypothetical protein